MAEIQIPLPFGTPLQGWAASFVTGPENLEAHLLVTGAGDWPARSACVVGPEGCGKTHLLRMWCERRRAVFLPAPALTLDRIAALDPQFSLAVDDADSLAGGADGETALFHLFNRALQASGTVLLSAAAAPGAWPVGLADLRSRLSGVVLARVEAPGEGLLRSVLLHELALRQLRPKDADDIIAKFLQQAERSLAAIKAFAGELDGASLEQRRDVSADLASRILKARGSLTDLEPDSQTH